MAQVEDVADDLGIVYDSDWWDRARCRGQGPNLFYECETKRPRSTSKAQSALRAKLVCQSCEVVESCLVFAVAHPKDDGVWGGTTADERETIRRRVRRLRVRSAYGEHESVEAV